MSSCATFREQMLEADPAELRADVGNDLSRHILGCAACRATAVRILESTDLLDSALGGAPRTIDATAIVSRALGRRPHGSVGPDQSVGLGGRSRRVDESSQRVGGAPEGARTRRRHVRAALGAAGVALAASIAALLLVRRPEPPRPSLALAPRVAAPAMVEAPADQNVAVIETTNPNITVLWFF